MAARDLPNLGLKAGYDPGENGWGDDMTLNLLKLSILTQGTAIDKVAAEPGGPTAGDVYILDETHATHPNEVIVFDGPVGEEAWVYITPSEGWLIFNQAADYYEKFDGAVWAELATGGGGGGSLPAFAGHSLEYLRVNAGETAAEWAAVAGGTTGTQLVEPYSQLFAPHLTNGSTFSSGFYGARAVYFPKAVTLKAIKMMIRGTAAGCTVTPAVYAITAGGVEGALVAQGASVVGVAPGILSLPLNADYPVAAGTMLIVGVIAQGAALPIAKSRVAETLYYAIGTSVPSASPAFTKGTQDWASMWPVVEDATPGGSTTGGRFRLPFFFTAAPTASETISIIIADVPFTIPANFAGAQYVNVGTPPAATFTVTVKKNGATIGTITISNTGVVTLATTGGLAQNVAAGDKITFVAQAGVDASIANVAGMLWGNETA